MTGRVESLMQAAGLKENVLGSLERGDSMFVLTDQTLLFQDSGGTRRVTLRDLKRIHSDQDGLLRVETPAGTALTASLLGFDPAAVQSFFAQVRDATAKAKQQANVTDTAVVPPAQTSRPTPAAPPATAPKPETPAAPPARPADAQWTGGGANVFTRSTPTPPVTSPTPVSPAADPLLGTRSGAATLTPAPLSSSPAASSSGAAPTPARTPTVPDLGLPRQNQAQNQPGQNQAVQAPATLATPSLIPPPRMQEKPVSPSPAASSAPAQAGTVKPSVKAVRTPTIITDPAVAPAFEEPKPRPAPETRPPAKATDPVAVETPAAAPVRHAPTAAGTLASLAAVADGVSAWTGRLRFLSVVMLVAALALAYLQFDKGQGLSGVWVLIAGGMSAVGLWALGDLTRLLVNLARGVSAEGGVMDVD